LGPRDIGVQKLMQRATDGVVQEVILATNFTAEGEATAHVIGEALQARAACGHAAGARRARGQRAGIRGPGHHRPRAGGPALSVLYIGLYVGDKATARSLVWGFALLVNIAILFSGFR
jgi:hypothetical protein